MRILGWLVLLLAMLGWSAWFVVCNVYEFAPRLDPWAFGYGWLLAVLAGAFARRNGWSLCALAGSVGLYLLLIHRGMGDGSARGLLLLTSVAIVGVTWWIRRAKR
ncbi:MAG: hypothetical protein ACN6RG_05530 [Stenotrophomonas sp.]|jgi:hypothetical protein